MEEYSIDPWGEQRADMRNAQAVVASLAPHSKRSLKLGDYMLFPEGGRLSEEDQWDLVLDNAAQSAASADAQDDLTTGG